MLALTCKATAAIKAIHAIYETLTPALRKRPIVNINKLI